MTEDRAPKLGAISGPTHLIRSAVPAAVPAAGEAAERGRAVVAPGRLHRRRLFLFPQYQTETNLTVLLMTTVVIRRNIRGRWITSGHLRKVTKRPTALTRRYRRRVSNQMMQSQHLVVNGRRAHRQLFLLRDLVILPPVITTSILQRTRRLRCQDLFLRLNGLLSHLRMS